MVMRAKKDQALWRHIKKKEKGTKLILWANGLLREEEKEERRVVLEEVVRLAKEYRGMIDKREYYGAEEKS